jgi:hypothetical protein
MGKNTREDTERSSLTIKGVGKLFFDLNNYLHGLSISTGAVVYM